MKNPYETVAEVKNKLDSVIQQIAELNPNGQHKRSVLEDGNIRVHAFLDSFEGFIYICSRDYRIVFMNERLIERVGHNATGNLCYKTLQDRDSICPWCVYERVFKGETVRWLLQSLKGNGWYYTVTSPIRKADGSLCKLSMIMDISELKYPLAQLKGHRNRLDELVSGYTAELMDIKEQLQREIGRRKQAQHELGRKNRDLDERVKKLNCLYGISKILSWPDLSSEEIFQGIVEIVPPAFRYPEVTGARILIKDQEFKTGNFKETHWEQKTAISAFGERIGTLGVCCLEERPGSDDGAFLKEEKNLIKTISEVLGRVTEGLQAETEVRSSYERFRILAENVTDAVMVVQAGKIVLANDNFISIFGFSCIDDVLGKDLGILNCPELQKQFGMPNEHIESNNYRKCVLRVGRNSPDGRSFWIDATSFMIKWEGESAILATLRDISESKLKQTSLVKVNERLIAGNHNFSSAAQDGNRIGELVGKSPAMQEVYDFVIRASASDANVVIQGESGTGKELVAVKIHKMSHRREKMFVPVNCGAIPEPLAESEFFGHLKGAFTGAYIDKPGLFDRAFGGSVFLDEVGQLSPNMQVKLLREIEGKGYSPVGSNKIKQSDIRIIAASNQNLK